jgi:hypothetical protein
LTRGAGVRMARYKNTPFLAVFLISALCLVPVQAQQVWPPTVPATAPDGAKTGEGYPERRVAKGSQWHDSEQLDLDNMRHIHNELAHPEIVRAGPVCIDQFTRHFHFQQAKYLGIRKVVTRVGVSAPKWMPTYIPGGQPGRRNLLIPPEGDGRDIDHWTPICVDLRAVQTFGLYTFEVDTKTSRPDGKTAVARLIWKMWVDPDGTHKPDRRVLFTHGEGWVVDPVSESNQFGYMAVTMFGAREYESDVSSTIGLVARVKVGRTATLMLMKNPDLHARPANYGEILGSWEFTGPKFQIVVKHPALNVGDRLVARVVDASAPTLGSAAQLATVRLSKG